MVTLAFPSQTPFKLDRKLTLVLVSLAQHRHELNKRTIYSSLFPLILLL